MAQVCNGKVVTMVKGLEDVPEPTVEELLDMDMSLDFEIEQEDLLIFSTPLAPTDEVEVDWDEDDYRPEDDEYV